MTRKQNQQLADFTECAMIALIFIGFAAVLVYNIFTAPPARYRTNAEREAGHDRMIQDTEAAWTR